MWPHFMEVGKMCEQVPQSKLARDKGRIKSEKKAALAREKAKNEGATNGKAIPGLKGPFSACSDKMFHFSSFSHFFLSLHPHPQGK